MVKVRQRNGVKKTNEVVNVDSRNVVVVVVVVVVMVVIVTILVVVVEVIAVIVEVIAVEVEVLLGEDKTTILKRKKSVKIEKIIN